LPEADLALLRDAAEEAGRIALHYFQNDPEVRDKGDGQGPVTEADLAVNAMLERDLRAARPDYGWLSEETDDTTARLTATRVFVIDPIDGTRAFIEGSADFSHALAIVDHGQVIAGVVQMPAKQRQYAAARGWGAVLNDAPISVTDTGAATGADILATRPNMKPDLWPGGLPDVTRHFRSSLAYRLSLVGSGRFDGMVTLRNAWEWDIAAGALIVTEAGGRATDRTGAPLRFNNPHPQTAGVLAAGAGVHADLLARL